MELRISVLVVLTLANVGTTASSEQRACILQGHLFTQLSWYGYLAQKTFRKDHARIQYEFTFPLDVSPKLLIYHDEQIGALKSGMSCEEREAILPTSNHQVISLKPNRTRGCSVARDADGPFVVCVGERNFASSGPKTWYFVVSRCRDTRLLSLWYRLNITGYYGDCEADPLTDTYIPSTAVYYEGARYTYIVASLGVVAGVALVALCLFVFLWCRLRRRGRSKRDATARHHHHHQRDKNSEDSLTSSQATMTQDIFFVNSASTPTGGPPPPATVLPHATQHHRLHDRDTSDYSRSSSENYYEVIASERRAMDAAAADRLSMQGRFYVRQDDSGPYASRSLFNENGGHVTFRHHINSPFTLAHRLQGSVGGSVPIDAVSNYRVHRPRYPGLTALATPARELANSDYPPPPPYQMDTIVRSSYPYPTFTSPYTSHLDRQRLIASLPPVHRDNLLRSQSVHMDEVAETLA